MEGVHDFSIGSDRFAFGKNWKSFIETLSEKRILIAQNALQERLGMESLEGKSFFDLGSGSGLMSLAARRLGAQVFSCDIDPESVECTQQVKARYFPDDDSWQVMQGSALDGEYLSSLGSFDIVYSWGVLHHTGNMWAALENVVRLVKPGGKLFVSIYNDQGHTSVIWLQIKKLYNFLPPPLRFLILVPTIGYIQGRTCIGDLLKYGDPSYTWRHYGSERGMSRYHDLIDWIGGLPFEVAKPEEVFDFYHDRGFTLLKLKTCAGGKGCNEFVLLKE